MEKNDLLKEFTIEALKLIGDVERGFLKIEKRECFSDQYNLILRSFNSLKGSSGMIEADKLKHYVHELETNFTTEKDNSNISEV